MNNLTIHIGDKNIGLVLPEGTISIDIKNSAAQQVIAPTKAAILDWSKTLLDGESVNYESAEKAANALGKGWRLPTRDELSSIIDLSRHDPAADTEKHPTIKSNYYWTSTPCAWNSAAVLVVYFSLGYVVSSHRNSYACVLAVRSSQ